MLYLVCVVVFVWAYGGYTAGRVRVIDTSQLSHLFDVLPTVAFGYQCHVSSVPIYHSIRNRDSKKYFTVRVAGNPGLCSCFLNALFTLKSHGLGHRLGYLVSLMYGRGIRIPRNS